MLIAAVGDVHSPRYLSLFRQALSNITRKPDIMLLAGDMIYRGLISEYATVLKTIEEFVGSDLKIYACFGNEEFENKRESLRKIYGEKIKFLDDEAEYIQTNQRVIAICGTQGSLYRPTGWQAKHIPGIAERYRRRIETVSKIIEESWKHADVVILLMHYAPSFKVMIGEKKSAYPWLGHPGFEKVIIEKKPSIVFYAHLHNAKIKEYELGGVKLYNVSLPATQKITLTEL
ncbi:MAG TPA: hypothetical protein ENF42_00090 [Candidatus Bathyarchaeota archaeon]|nr:hypothetical protein [Candidatus Bathyarchaeota archaeon]